LKALFDQNVPHPWQKYLTAHDVKRADELGWSELTNGDRRQIAVVCMSDNHWPIVRRHIPAIVDALKAAQPGTLTTVDCGAFALRKRQKHHPLS
jgi:hypothetical protein